ncbi:hypothetical protein [Nevskia ramosa]|uniref:hypothetical protein n=1 Tax=Nevskia ramosa TaxID=64002 RepID=UPI003D13830A
MGSEIAILIVLPGFGAFLWCSYKILTTALPDRAAYFLALLIGLGLGVRGMVNAYLPSIPENWNTSFLVGWFLMSASFWLIVATALAAVVVPVLRKTFGKTTTSSAERT